MGDALRAIDVDFLGSLLGGGDVDWSLDLDRVDLYDSDVSMDRNPDFSSSNESSDEGSDDDDSDSEYDLSDHDD